MCVAESRLLIADIDFYQVKEASALAKQLSVTTKPLPTVNLLSDKKYIKPQSGSVVMI